MMATSRLSSKIATRQEKRGKSHSRSLQLYMGAACLGLLLAVFFVFSALVSTYFAQEDFSILLEAKYLTFSGFLNNLRTVAPLFSPDTTSIHFFRPLQSLYLALIIRFLGVQPSLFHFSNIILLTINATLLIRVSSRLGVGWPASIVTGLFYGCHPIFIWPIMWISASSSLLVSLTTLATIDLMIPPRSRLSLILAASTFLLALGSRENAIIIPALACMVLFVLQRHQCADVLPPWKCAIRAVVQTSLLWLTCVAYLLMRINDAQRIAQVSDYDLSLGWHLVANALRLMAHATGVGVGADQQLVGGLELIFRIAFWGVLIVGALLLHRKGRPLALMGLAWFFVSIVPYVGLERHGMYAYYIDIALIGIAVSAGAMLDEVIRVLRRTRWSIPLMGFVVLLCITGSRLAVRAEAPKSAVSVQARRAEALMRELRRCGSSLRHAATLYIIGMDESMVWATAFGDLFRFAYGDPRLKVIFVRDDAPWPDARDGIRKAGTVFSFEEEYGNPRLINLTAEPDCVQFLILQNIRGADDIRRVLQRGRALVNEEKWNEAAEVLEPLADACPVLSPEACYLTAFSLQQMGLQAEHALMLYHNALTDGFDEFWVRYNRAHLHLELGRIVEAAEDAKRACELNPEHAGAAKLLKRVRAMVAEE